jgi:hypothetical protein
LAILGVIMTNNQTLALIFVRTLALSLAAQGFNDGLRVYKDLFMQAGFWRVLLPMASVGAPLILAGIILWFMARLLAIQMVEDTSGGSDSGISLTPETAQAAAGRAFGLYFFVAAACGIVRVVLSYLQWQTASKEMIPDLTNSMAVVFVLNAFQGALGLWILLDAERFIAFLRKVSHIPNRSAD